MSVTEGACDNFNSYNVRLHALSFSLAYARQRLACGLVSQKFAEQTKGKTIINRFLTPSRHFVTSRREPYQRVILSGVRDALHLGAVEPVGRHEVSGSLIDRLSQTPHPQLRGSRLRAHVTKVCVANLSSDSHLDCHSLLSVSLRYPPLQRSGGFTDSRRRLSLQGARDRLSLQNGGSKPPPYKVRRPTGMPFRFPTLQRFTCKKEKHPCGCFCCAMFVYC